MATAYTEASIKTLSAHLRNVAELAATFAAPFNASDEARLAGLLHKFFLNLPRFNHLVST